MYEREKEILKMLSTQDLSKLMGESNKLVIDYHYEYADGVDYTRISFEMVFRRSPSQD